MSEIPKQDELIHEYIRATNIAEALLVVIDMYDIRGEVNHHVRNAVAGLRGVDMNEDRPEEILTLCQETQERLRPFLPLLKKL